MTLFPEQLTAVERILTWLANPSGPREFKLGGYAGTGKTTIIRYLLDALKADRKDVALCAFTGKAVSVLRKKGCYSAETIHATIYIPRKGPKGDVTFTLRGSLDVDVFVIDEASMVSEDIYRDLMSFKKPVLWVGDPGQLEPVGNDINLMAKCDYVLETIHRQGEGSQILRFADAMRHNITPQQFRLVNGELQELTLLRRSQMAEVECNQFICGFNKTRIDINKRMRRQMGFASAPLNVGERLCVLKNSADAGVFNGMLLAVLAVDDPFSPTPKVTTKDELDQELDPIYLKADQLGNAVLTTPYDLKLASIRSNKNLILADYGYCLTGHKSQGSEWDTVAVIEEIWYEKWAPSRWRYTTATRAVKKLLYFF